MDVILFSSADFDFIRTRKQQVALELSRIGHRVIYIEPPRAGKWADLPLARHNLLSQKSENLFVYSPPVLPYMGRFPVINEVNYELILFNVRRIAARLGFSDLLYWIYPPRAFSFAGRFHEKLTVFDCIQYWPYSSEPDWIKNRLPEYLKRAQVVFAPDPQILSWCREYNKDAVLVPHGVDTAYLAEGKPECPPDLALCPRPVVGISASISSYWIDMELVRKLAVSNPQWTFAVIGPLISNQELDLWRGVDNIRYLGLKKPSELPAYVRNFDLGLIPFRRIPAVKGILPLKFYDYMASGLPIVSTTPVEIDEYREFAVCGEGAFEISSLIASGMAEDSFGMKGKRLSMARNSTWKKRVEDMLKHIRI
ncbi:MAG: glycosyltransferase [Candidatus Wallbacteria bacterium]|nr:glycosyltransferase [Candidatus Wallbacteria bacterium]